MTPSWLLGPGTGNPYADFTDACNALRPVNAVDFAWCDTVVMERKALQ